MDDSCLVRCLEAGCNLRGYCERLVGGESSTRQLFVETLPLDELHDEVDRPPVFLQPVERRDVGVAERAEEARFTLESGPALGVTRKGVREGFDRHIAPHSRIARAPDLPHPAATEGREDLEGTDARARLERHRRSAKTAWTSGGV